MTLVTVIYRPVISLIQKKLLFMMDCRAHAALIVCDSGVAMTRCVFRG